MQLRSILAAMLLSSLALAGCSVAPEESGDGSSGSKANFRLVWPEGYDYDARTGRLYTPSSAEGRAAPSYVTRVGLRVTGERLDTIFVDMPLDTLNADVTVTIGRRTFDVLVQTDIGVDFTGSRTVDIFPFTSPTVVIVLEVNGPPKITDIYGDLDFPNRILYLHCSADDPDGDQLVYGWDGPGGWRAFGKNPSYNLSDWTPGAGNSFTCNVADGHGGFDSATISKGNNELGTLDPPTGGTGTPHPSIAGRIRLEWNAVTDAASYNMYWRRGDGASGTVTGIGSAFYIVTGCPATQEYWMRLTSVDSAGNEGVMSQEYGPVSCPGVTQVIGTNAVDANPDVALTWTGSTNHNGVAATAYKVYYRAGVFVSKAINDGSFILGAVTGTTDTASVSCQGSPDMGNNTSYIITATDGTYTSDPSDIFTVTCDGV